MLSNKFFMEKQDMAVFIKKRHSDFKLLRNGVSIGSVRVL